MSGPSCRFPPQRGAGDCDDYGDDALGETSCFIQASRSVRSLRFVGAS